ncbi:MAG: cell wall-binding repeat-containing protein [Acidimicrobiales bacterium]
MTTRGLRRRAAGMVALTSLLGGLVLLWMHEPAAHGAANVTQNRLSGSDRYATAAAIAEATVFPSGRGTFALLARGDQFPDALAAAGLAGAAKQGVILLTPGDTLSPAAATAMQQMSIQSVAIIGGTNAISANVEHQLEKNGYSKSSNPPTLARLDSPNRFVTAAAIAYVMKASPQGIGTIKSAPTAIVATAAKFADALAAGPMAFVDHFPVLLTDPDALAPESQKAMTDLGIKNVIIAGGTAAVASGVEDKIKSLGITTQRFAGKNRQETAALIAQFEVGTLAFDATTVELARGDNFPDGLAASPFAGRTGDGKGAPILLTGSPTDLSAETLAYLQSANGPITHLNAFGGTEAIAQAVLDKAVGTATCATSTTSTSSSSTSSSSTTTSSTTSSTTSTTTTTPGTSTTTSTPPSTPCGTGATTTSGGPTTSTSSTTSSTSTTSTTSTTAAPALDPKITGAGSGPGMTIDVTYDKDVTCQDGAAGQFKFEPSGSASDPTAPMTTHCVRSTASNRALTLTFNPGVPPAIPMHSKLVYSAPATPSTTNAVYAGPADHPVFALSGEWDY